MAGQANAGANQNAAGKTDDAAAAAAAAAGDKTGEAGKTGDQAGAGKTDDTKGGQQQQGEAGTTGDQGKGADGAAAQGKGKDGAAAAAPKAPAKYELVVPEANQKFVDAEDVAAFESIARENDWTNEDAQAYLIEQAEQRAAMSAKFHADATADKEIGGDKLEESQRLVKSVLDKFLPESEADGKKLRTALTKLGLGSYPPLVRLLVRIGKAGAEDSPGNVGAQGAAGGQKDAASTLYDHPTSRALDQAAGG